ncbi:MAG: sigma-70 family RNA polymerase sigma factor [Candidatus Saccharicenans sp.]|nr:sigma-70 family RNA polymerase sigma factor [Candidatus Saccharicenans sp.]MDI6850311.1 sigma-70 family RNA polymerase sigma factor [Candidatus Saccharicenans sp.]
MDEREKELVWKALSGESSAFEELVLPYRRSLLHLAYRMTGDMEEAMDIAQETLLRSFRYLGRFDQERNFRNWLFQIAANLAKDWQRKKKLEAGAGRISIEAEAPDNPGLGRAASSSSRQPASEMHSDLNLDLNGCLRQLSPRERQVFILRDLEGLSIRKTADLLKTSSLSVRVSLSSARKKIRQILGGQKTSGPEDGDANEM